MRSEQAKNDTWPRDEWAYAEASNGSWHDYIFHMHHPRFIIRVVEVDHHGFPLAGEDDPDLLSTPIHLVKSQLDREEAEELAGVDYSDAYILCEPVWIDAVDPDDQPEWMRRAAEVFF